MCSLGSLIAGEVAMIARCARWLRRETTLAATPRVIGTRALALNVQPLGDHWGRLTRPVARRSLPAI
jgi:hypothetical protein